MNQFKKTSLRAACASLALSAMAFGLSQGCSGMTAPGSSGETHFLAFCRDSCGPGLECLCGVCTRACDAENDCSGLGASVTCVERATCEHRTCDAACDADADCRRLGPDYTCEAGYCRYDAIGLPPRDAGGSGGAAAGGDASGSGGTSSGAGGSLSGSGGQGELDAGACPEGLEPPSTCSRAEFCEQVGCGGFDFDDQGCRRPPCEDDATCSADERCVYIECAGNTGCVTTDDGCECLPGPPVCLTESRCAPVTLAGPRGQWQQFEIVRQQGPCPPGGDCESRWTVTPDGAVTTMKLGVPGTAQMQSFAIEELSRRIDGTSVRREMRDGFSCGPIPPDLAVSFSLVLPGETLSQGVTGCIISDDGNSARQLYQLVTSY